MTTWTANAQVMSRRVLHDVNPLFSALHEISVQPAGLPSSSCNSAYYLDQEIASEEHAGVQAE